MFVRNSFLRNPKSFSRAFSNFRGSVKASTKAPKIVFEKASRLGESIHEDFESLNRLKGKTYGGNPFKAKIMPKAERPDKE